MIFGIGKLVLASHNRKKTHELRAILQPLAIELLNLADFAGAPSPEETGSTFAENAILKAREACAFTGLAALADDSGLVVDALAGEPGVLSARFAGEGAGDAANNRLLLERLRGVPAEKRTARFVAVVAFALPGGECRTWSGETHGRILEEERGEGGFGYDPLFFSDDLGVGFAEAPEAEKNRISHRGRALEAFIADLRNG